MNFILYIEIQTYEKKSCSNKFDGWKNSRYGLWKIPT